jgi:hypothetical protein
MRERANDVEVFLWKPPGPLKGWKRDSGYYGVAADGTVYLNAAVFADLLQALLCAGYDGEGMITINPATILFRAAWLKQCFPAHRSAIETIERRIQAGRNSAFDD